MAEVHELEVDPDALVQIWCVGRIMNNEGGWALVGVFSDEQNALNACEVPTDFVAPAFLDRRLYIECGRKWEGSYWPFATGCDA